MAWVIDTCLVIDVLDDDAEFGVASAVLIDSKVEAGLVISPVRYTEEAYQRLGAWKESPKDSFLKVVERVVPARGNLHSVMAAWEALPPLSEKQFNAIQTGLRAFDDWGPKNAERRTLNVER